MMVATEQPPLALCSMRGITRAFPGVVALHDVDLDLRAGEVHVLAGENGSGKSTLCRILAGVDHPESGSISLDGRPVTLAGVPHAMAEGIVLISQELTLVPSLSIAENIFLGGRHARRSLKIDWRRTHREAASVLAHLGSDLSTEERVGKLPHHQQQLVEIARALSMNARILIMDEPTSALSLQEVEVLIRVIRGLRDDGVAIIFISHRLKEMFAVADRFTILRDGQVAARAAAATLTEDAVIRHMVGRSLDKYFPDHEQDPGPRRLELKDLVDAEGVLRRVSVELRAGEVVGLAGLVGAGKTELLETAAGIRPRIEGSVSLDGRSLDGEVAASMKRGLALVPDDRKNKALVLDLSVHENLLLANGSSSIWRRSRRKERRVLEPLLRRVGVRSGLHVAVRYLSGGNQQKVVLARWLAQKPAVLLLDEPTRGIDVAAKADIYRLLIELATDGVAIMFASSELEEVIGLSDRVLVMHAGKIAAELRGQDVTEEAIISAASGREATTEEVAGL